ncbi:MAG: DNA repair protein RecO [Actinomycetaceae bacterium]|nr:DNA repair protein RecO [Actinomycetaceae bacterium]
MRTYRDQGVVLRTHKLGEADRIISILTANFGLVRVVARGVRRIKSKFGARLEPFSNIDFQAYRGKNLDTLTQVETIAAYGNLIAADYSLYTAGTVMLEVAEKITAEGAPTAEQYQLLRGALHALANRRQSGALVMNSYILRALAIAGWAPSCTECANCGSAAELEAFSVVSGGLLCAVHRTSAAVGISADDAQVLAALRYGNWEALAHASSATVRKVGGLVAAYAQWHLERRIKSLPLLELDHD